MSKPLHPKASRLQRAGLFAGLKSFDELETRIAALPDERARGDAFEVFAEAYLATQRRHDLPQVWPLAAVPTEALRKLALPLNDYGVDGVAQTVLGGFDVYQVKFRSGRPPLTWRELSTFMGLADSASIHSRVLFTNCDDLPAVMNERTGFFCIRGSDLDRLEESDFRVIESWLAQAQVPTARKQPHPHQHEALDVLLPALRQHNRVTGIMACGTGKTLVALWVAERMQAQTILVLLPSLALLRQTLHEWLHETSLPSLAYLCVCSDPTVKQDLDAIATPQSDLDFPVTTDRRSVREFLDAPFTGAKTIFSTYQSARVVGEALRKGETFDLGIFDEAHKTAGREGRNYAFALEDSNLPIRKRLFLTATPRHYNPQRKDQEGDAQLVFSMDKPQVYGEQAFRLSFAEAARRGIICNYKVVISVITSGMVTNELLSRGEVLVNGDAIRARQVANQLALTDVIAKYGVNKVFTFHRTVKSAESFVADGSEGIGTHLSDAGRVVLPHRLNQKKWAAQQRSPAKEFQTFHVNGTMPTAQRERVMQDFRAASRAVMSNARCLTEGVDVPAVDMVAFLSPRRSRVDIVQATGRAMRRAPSKTTGYVLVPLYLEQAAGESIEEAVSRTEFEEVWDVLQSLQEQDEVMAEIIREMREEKGRTKGFDDSRFRERIVLHSPQINIDEIRAVITTTCIENIGSSWDESYGLLQKYKEREGDCLVKALHVENGFNLGSWVHRQRYNQENLTPEQRRRLDELGFVWEVSQTPLTEIQILKWADAHHQKTGEWPKVKSGEVLEARGEKWSNLDSALSKGQRGLPGGSSVAQLLAENREVRNMRDIPKLSVDQIVQWADEHHHKAGQWPKIKSGDVMGAPGEKWANISAALSEGQRGLSGGSSLAKLLAEKRGVRNRGALSNLTLEQILRWADEHRQKTEKWPNRNSGNVFGTPEENWKKIDAALALGQRGLSGGSSLAKLLAEKRSVRSTNELPNLTVEQILQWADIHRQNTGKWPNQKSGDVPNKPGERWANINAALNKGGRGLIVGSSLAQLLAEKRGVRNMKGLPDLSFERILQWIDTHHQTTGQWPKVKSGEVLGASGEKWANIDAALSQGLRGLPGGSSLALLLAEQRGVRNHLNLPDLTIEIILQWADAQHQKTGQWPKSKSDAVLNVPGERWINIEAALSQGGRGLPGGSSLAKLLSEMRGVRNEKSPPSLAVNQILQWAQAHQQKTGQWPKRDSGEVLDAPGEKWANINAALFQGLRSLPGGSSLAKLLADKRPKK